MTSEGDLEHRRFADQTVVVIPAFNAEATVGQAINSALAIGLRRVVVVDDGSTDRTGAVSVEHGAIVVRQTNQGAGAARHRGLAEVDGKYVIFLDADDLLLHGMLGCIALLGANDALGVAAGSLSVLGKSRVLAAQRIRPGYDPVDTSSMLLHGYAPWPPVAQVIRKSVLDGAAKLSPRPLEPRFAEDYETLLRCSRVARIGVYNGVVAAYAVAGGKSAKNANLSLDSAQTITAYYGDAWNLEYVVWSTRTRRRLLATRRIQAVYDSGGRAGLLRAAARDPDVAAALAASALRRLRLRRGISR